MTKPPMTLQEAVTSNLEKYFEDLDNTQPGLIYDMVLSAVEKPMLEVVMRHAGGNARHQPQYASQETHDLRSAQ